MKIKGSWKYLKEERKKRRKAYREEYAEARAEQRKKTSERRITDVRKKAQTKAKRIYGHTPKEKLSKRGSQLVAVGRALSEADKRRYRPKTKTRRKTTKKGKPVKTKYITVGGKAYPVGDVASKKKKKKKKTTRKRSYGFDMDMDMTVDDILNPRF